MECDRSEAPAKASFLLRIGPDKFLKNKLPGYKEKMFYSLCGHFSIYVGSWAVL